MVYFDNYQLITIMVIWHTFWQDRDLSAQKTGLQKDPNFFCITDIILWKFSSSCRGDPIMEIIRESAVINQWNVPFDRISYYRFILYQCYTNWDSYATAHLFHEFEDKVLSFHIYINLTYSLEVFVQRLVMPG